MSKLNQIECVTGYKNVGFGTCVFDPKQIAGALLFPEERTFTTEEVADLQDTLATLAEADNKSERMYPLHKFVAVTDNTEEPVIETTDYGSKMVVRDGDYDLSFKFFDGALCLLTALQTFNGPTPFLLYDKKNRIIGSKTGGLLSTIKPHFFHAMPWRVATGAAAANYMVRLSFTPEQINQNLGFVEAGFDLTDITGLKDVEIVVNSFNQGTGVANVTVQTLCNKQNIGANLATELANAGRWVCSNKATGAAITVTNATAGTGNTFNVTVDTGDSDFPSSGGTILLNLAAVSVLKAASIVGYEGIEAEIAISAS